jgi:hypothetical protein
MTKPKRDCTGDVFGFLTVIGKEVPPKGRTLWILRCRCGNIIKRHRGNFDSVPSKIKSCGCLRKLGEYKKRQPKDITEKRFGNLTIIRLLDEKIQNRPTWLAKCDCGEYRKITNRQLFRGFKLNCGAPKHLPGSWYPPTPEKLPELAWETVINFLPLTNQITRHNNAAIRDEKVERLIRVAWILFYRESNGEILTESYKKNYISKHLRYASYDVFWQNKLAQNGGLLYTVNNTKKELKRLRNDRSNISSVPDISDVGENFPENMSVQIRKLRFKRC